MTRLLRPGPTAGHLRASRGLRLLAWAAAAWIAWELLYYEQYKLTGNEGSIDGVFQPLADWFGIPAHEKPLRLGVAILEIVASVLVLLPGVRLHGALLALGTMGGAIVFHTVGPIGIDPYGDGGTLFKEACFTFLASGLLVWLHRDELEARLREAWPRRGMA
ncbi:MAG: hypothetical protein K2X11_08000 [Acetobacteraceae bacterium]|nr:hypothetical protein [Acetobacteraceae bacterium]